jgi:hypothetical protein
MVGNKRHIDQIEKAQDRAIAQSKYHRVSSNLDFNDVLDQYYLIDSSSLIAVFSNVKINGRPQTVDVTRRIKESTINTWDFKIAQNTMDILTNFSIKEFNHIIELIKQEGVGECDCYKVEKKLIGVSLPLNTYIFLVEQELSLSAKFTKSLASPHVNSALLIFKRTGDFEREISMVSRVTTGKFLSKEKVDREKITNYDHDDAPKKKKSAAAGKPAPVVPQVQVTSKEEEEQHQVVMALLKGEKKISFLSPQEQHSVIAFLERKKHAGALTSTEEKLLKMTTAYRASQ